MPDIHFECPKCTQSIDAPEELANQLIECPICKETIEVPVRSRRESAVVQLSTLGHKCVMSPIRTAFWKRFGDNELSWNVAGWVLAVAAFVFATIVSYRTIHYNSPNDLRSPVVLLVDALLASVVALGFAVHEGSLKHWTDAHLCLRFGLWAAAIFRLVPPIINEDILFYRGEWSLDLPYIVLGACIHGGLALLLASPYAIRVLNLPVWADDESLRKLCITVVLVFFGVAGVVRLLAEQSLWNSGTP
jgi:hypothetical protein